ncbi:MAG TPA: pilus assembly protein CpaE [Acidiphilium sp.]|nr:pilus assembly protein CpaE [Acidiphilium sp.]HQU23721.1 pilus assembly protein CpaE [Acidiphilium sp.]
MNKLSDRPSMSLKDPTSIVEREKFLGFVSDQNSLACIRTVLSHPAIGPMRVKLSSFEETLAALGAMRSPRTVLVDISGEDQPLSALMRLEQVIEPGTRVLVTGDVHSVAFYRTLTRNLGIREYLPKPLDPAQLARDLLPWATGDEPRVEAHRGGSLIAVRGLAGGVGASTVAANLAWLIGVETRRHTVLLDGDLLAGSAALAANVAPSSGLRSALETPDRIDPLLIERSAQAASDRLHVLAAEEPYTEKWSYHPGAGRALVEALRQRYNFIIADLPCRVFGFAAELLGLANQSVFVTDLSPRSVSAMQAVLTDDQARSAATHVAFIRRPHQRVSRASIENALPIGLGRALIDWDKSVRIASDLGSFASAKKGPFRTAMLDLVKSVGAIMETNPL